MPKKFEYLGNGCATDYINPGDRSLVQEGNCMVLDISTTNDIITITLVRRFDSDSAPVVENELKKLSNNTRHALFLIFPVLNILPVQA